MIYRYDQPVDMPIPELYDTGLMQAYTQAIREQFEKGEKRLDEFASKYGNFTSPFAKDIQDWDRLTMGRINNIYNDLVSRGIDPLRSREGQMLMAQAIRQTPVGKLNQLRQSAAIGEQYLKAKGDLQAKGLYSQEMEDYFLKHPFSQWSTSENGLFNRTSPLQYKDIHDITDDWFKHSEKKFDEKLTKQKADGYDYYTVSEDDIRGIINSNINDFLDSDYGRYYYQKEKNLVQRLNPTATQDQIENMAMQKFKDDIVNRNSDYLRSERKVNEYAKLNYEDKLERRRKQWEWANKPSSRGSGGPQETQNYHQNMLLNGLYNLSGKTDFLDPRIPSGTKTTIASKALSYLKDAVKGFDKNPNKRLNQIINYTTIQGSEEKPSFIGEKFNHKEGKSYGNWMIGNKKVEGLTLSQNELNTLISDINWGAMTANSNIKHSPALHKNIANLSKKTISYEVTDKNNRSRKVTKTKPKYRFILIPDTYNNVATTIDKNGGAVQANRGTLYAVNTDDNSKQINLGKTFIPFNRTDPVTTDGKAKTNEITTASGYRTRTDQQENSVRKVLGMKNTDKGANTGDYDY